MLRLNCGMRKAFLVHFRDHYAQCFDLPVKDFHSYSTDLTYLWEAEMASCKGVFTECKVHEALKQVGLNKSPWLDGLPYTHFVPILTDMFNYWFAQGAIPGSVTKGMIPLLKKGGRYVWEDLDDYRPITLLNTELKI